MSTLDCPYFDRDYKKYNIFSIYQNSKKNQFVCHQIAGNNIQII